MNSGVVTNLGPVAVTFGFPPGAPKVMTAEALARFQAIPWADRPGFMLTPNTASYFPVFYLPASFGLGLGHVLGISPYGALLLARVTGLLTFVALGACALFVARRGHALLFATLVLPMTLWVGATLNQDGVMIAALCLAAALLTRATRPGGWCYWTAGVLLTCVIAVKPPYFLFATAMLLPWQPRVRGHVLPAMAGVGLAVLPAMAWTILAQSAASGIFIQGLPYHPGPLWPGDPATLFSAPDPHAQLQVFLHRPALLVRLAVERLRQDAAWKLNEAIGILGLLEVILPLVVYPLWKLALAGSLLSGLFRGAAVGPRPSWLGSAAVGIALIATVFLVYDAQYLSWTPVGKDSIDGVQGRYFLPILPLLAIALPPLSIAGGGWVRGALAVPAVALALAGAIGLPLLVIRTYYLP